MLNNTKMEISSKSMYKQISPEDFVGANKSLLEVQATLVRLQRKGSNYKDYLKESQKLKTKFKTGFSALKSKIWELESHFPKEKKEKEKVVKGKKIATKKSLTKKRVRKEPKDPLDKELEEIQERLNALS